MEYDEEAAIAYVRQQLPEGSCERFDDDEILNVIDTVWDYYDENGFLDLDLDDDGPDELDEADLLVYVKKMMAKDRRSPLTTEDIEAIVKAELDYEDSIE
ncbi:MAG: hypothetical protein K2N16_07985 [Muribaculaceae bacterium]|nr:hypothetical protein [Muribaculaceae bacterium]